MDRKLRGNKMGKRFSMVAILVSVMLVAAVPVLAIPEVQSYIVGAAYDYTDETWITAESNFTYKAVGCWAPYSSAPQPPYDEMRMYVVIGVPKGQTGRLWIDGYEITGFSQAHPTDAFADLPNNSLYKHEPMGQADFQMYELGLVNNQYANAYHYFDDDLEMVRGWGGEISVDVRVEGFEWVHLDAVGVGVYDNITYVNPYSHDAGVVPEPGTLSLLGIGLLGMVPLLRRKKKQ